MNEVLNYGVAHFSYNNHNLFVTCALYYQMELFFVLNLKQIAFKHGLRANKITKQLNF